MKEVTMDYEAQLNQALDLLADSDEGGATRILQKCIDHIKSRLSGTAEDLPRYYYWGRCLTAMEEFEQALLKFEKALRLDPGHEASLWEAASILLHDLDRPENAKTLIAERLLHLRPSHPPYEDALRTAEFTLRIRSALPKEREEDFTASDSETGDVKSP
jgi:tetratricopeptide (TPR) repeat protein